MNLNACEGCLSINRSLKTVDENERKLFYSFINIVSKYTINFMLKLIIMILYIYSKECLAKIGLFFDELQVYKNFFFE